MATYYRRLCELLTKRGCYFLEQAKGSHEKWYSPITNRQIVIPSNVNSRFTANGVLKDAGIRDRL